VIQDERDDHDCQGLRAVEPDSLAALFQTSRHPSQNVRYQVLKSLQRNGWKAGTQAEKEAILQVVRDEVGALAWSIAAEMDLEAVDQTDHLREAFTSYRSGALERAFLALQLLYDEQVIKLAQQSLKSDQDENQRAYAIEVMDLTLSAEMRNLVTPLLRGMDPHVQLVDLSRYFPQERQGLEARIANILEISGTTSDRWLHAVALYTAGELGSWNYLIWQRYSPISI
jgi:hypothetical protein